MIVPPTSGRTPKLGVAKSGVQLVPKRKSAIGTSRRKANVSTASTAMIPIVVPMESRAQRNSAHSITNSNRFIPRLAVALRPAQDDPERRRRVEGLSLFCEQRFERHADLGSALAERRAGLPVSEVFSGQFVDLRRELDVTDFPHEIRAAEEHLDELLDFGTIRGFTRHIYEQRPRQRLVRTVAHRLSGRGDRARPIIGLPVVNRDKLQLLSVRLDIRKGQEAQGELVAGHALDDDVVILAGREISTAGAFLADRGFGEIVVGAGIHAGAEQPDLAVRPRGAYLIPSRDLALSLGRPERLQLFGRDRGGPGVLRIHDDGQTVVRDRDLDIFDAGFLAGFDLGGTNRTRGIADVGLAAAELLKAAARAGDAHGGSARVRVFLAELFGDRFRDREDRARAVDRDES